MKKIIEKLDAFFFKNVTSYEWISFFRIAIALLVLMHFISILPDFNLLFSTKGIIPSDILDVYVPQYVVTFPEIIHFFLDYGISEKYITLIFIIMFILCCIFLIIGFLPRIFSLFLLFMQCALVNGSSTYIYGVDFFTGMSLFYLILIPSHYQHSIYTLLKIKTIKTNLTPYRRLFQIHISIVYFFSGLDKFVGYNWRNGESVWKAINLPTSNQDFNFDFTFLGHNPWILILLGWTTIIIEMLYPIFIWLPKTRNIWLCLTITFHLGIALVLNLYFFSAIMIIWNLTNFYNFEQSKKQYVKIRL